MTSRDTYDIEEYKKEQIASINVQPKMLIGLMMESEPSLFSTNSEVAIKPHEIPPYLLNMYMVFLEAAKKHAQLQIDFDKSLKESL